MDYCLTVWRKRKLFERKSSIYIRRCARLPIRSSSQTQAKISTKKSVKYTTGKHIMIVPASKWYLVDWWDNLMGDFFPTFVAKLQGGKVLQNSPNRQWKKILMLQNELLRKTRSSYSLSTIYLRLLHFGRFMDELFKPCERLKLPVVIKNCCR